jgi:hypothetical protein
VATLCQFFAIASCPSRVVGNQPLFTAILSLLM